MDANTNEIIFEDYGTIPSFRRLPHEKEILKYIDLHKRPSHSYVRHNIVNFEALLGARDIHYLIKGILETNGVGFIKILPYGQHEYIFSTYD